MISKLKQMMEQLIAGKYDCNDFSYDFPNEMLELDDDKAHLILDDMPEICADYDMYKEDEEFLFNEEEFVQKVKEVYNDLIAAGY